MKIAVLIKKTNNEKSDPRMRLELKKNDKYQVINAIDAHTEGEPLRIVTEGYPTIEGRTMLEKRRYLLNNLDHLRQILMYEPRGHADMYGALITEAVTDDGDFGILFMHNEGYSSMCGHGIIAAVTVALECGAIEVAPGQFRQVNIDSPAGRIVARAAWRQDVAGKQVPDVSFKCVPSFVECTGRSVYVEGLGAVRYEIAFGGAYYAYVDADYFDLDCSPDNVTDLIEFGRAIKQAVIQDYAILHPVQDDLSFLYGTIFTSQKALTEGSHSRHVCIFADGEVDRSPTGTGVSGRIALLHHKGEVDLNQTITIESIIGSSMQVCASDTLIHEGKPSVIPQVRGSAYITGEHRFLLDSKDPLKNGFLLR